MKRLRSVLALAISLSMALLAPGGTAWAQAAQVVGGAASVSIGGSAASVAGAANRGAAAAPAKLVPSLSLTTLAPSLAVPSGLTPITPVSLSAAGAAPLSAAEVPAAARTRAVLSLTGANPGNKGISAQSQVKALSANLAEDFNKVGDQTGSSENSQTAGRSIINKLAGGQDAGPGGGVAPVVVDGIRAGAASPLSRYRASASNSPAIVPVGRTSATRAARSVAVPMFAAVATAVSAAVGGLTLIQPLALLPLILISLILHEIGHAKAAKALGDPTATSQGRASFNPLTWYKHISPIMTIALPVVTYLTSGFIFGGAKPAPIDSSRFKHPTRDMALVAFAGPAVNLALAALGALAYAGAIAGGLGPVVLGTLIGFVFFNAVLGIFNLIPILPLDGGHILLAVAPRAIAQRISAFYAKIGLLGMLPIMLVAIKGGGAIMATAAILTHVLIGASLALTGVQLAGAALPAVAALGMIGYLRSPPGVARLTAGGPSVPGTPAASDGADRPVELVVMFSPEKALTKDLHLSSVDPLSVDYVQAYQGVQSSMLSQLDAVGLSPETLAAYGASPVASYRRINAATIRVEASKAAEFEAALRARGDKVFPNERRQIIIPAPLTPQDADPSSRGPVSMSENLSITKADAVQAIARERFGGPGMNPWRKLKAAFGFGLPAQPAVAVVDSGADTSHPLLKRVKEVKNETSGENVDDIGHGSWVTSMVLNYAPWSKNVTHYKTFLNGGATLDDILKSLTAAANDGNLVISNSWGSDEGDPESPDSVLVKKLASEGHVLVFAAGNAGPGQNTVGSPAIVQYKDPATGAIRVVAVAATDRDKKVAFFSSRGPGSPKTAGKDGFAHRPDLAALGSNTEGAWPAALGGDRTDPQLGSVKAISGTSMSTPSVAGALALLLIMFGVTAKGAKLDAVVNAVMATVEKTGKNGVDDEGDGFLNVTAAYELLYKQFNPGGTPPTVAAEYRRLNAKIRDNDARRKEYLGRLTGGPGVREELLEHYYRSMAPEFDADEGAMAVLLRTYPNANYEVPSHPPPVSAADGTGAEELSMNGTPMFIVEDDDHFRETFIDVMSLKGVEVSGARNGDEAIKALKQNKPSVIIMDINLPDVHGFDLCRRVRRLENQKDTPIIFVSASTKYSDPRDREEGLLAGASQFLPKPISVERLWEEIESVLGGGRG